MHSNNLIMLSSYYQIITQLPTMCVCSVQNGGESNINCMHQVCMIVFNIATNTHARCVSSHTAYTRPSVFSFHTLTVPSSEQVASSPGCLGLQLTLFTSVVCACPTEHSRVKMGSFGDPADEGSYKHGVPIEGTWVVTTSPPLCHP